MRMLTVTNGNNDMQGPRKSQQSGGGRFMVSALAIKASARRTRKGSSGRYCHMPHPTPRWGPREVFFGRCLQDEAGESISPPPHWGLEK